MKKTYYIFAALIIFYWLACPPANADWVNLSGAQKKITHMKNRNIMIFGWLCLVMVFGSRRNIYDDVR